MHVHVAIALITTNPISGLCKSTHCKLDCTCTKTIVLLACNRIKTNAEYYTNETETLIWLLLYNYVHSFADVGVL